jgi:hypothetical protein
MRRGATTKWPALSLNRHAVVSALTRRAPTLPEIMEMNEMVIESDSATFGEEALRGPVAWVNSANDSSDPKAPARGIFAGTVLGSAFWAGALALLHALLS